MRLRVSLSTANEELVRLINRGYQALSRVEEEYAQKVAAGQYNDAQAVEFFGPTLDQWATELIAVLEQVFPTELEINRFVNPEIPFGVVSGHNKYQSFRRRFLSFINGLDMIRRNSLAEYTDLPIRLRLYIEDIESFRKVRDINPAAVADLLNEGYLDRSEDSIQMALEQILNVPMHKKDWGGEINDLYTANLVVNGARTETAFMLKGSGLKRRTLEIADCGANGDQLVRLVESPARLFIVQFVGNISESVIRDIEGKVQAFRGAGKDAWFCIMDGQDTARLLRAYGKL